MITIQLALALFLSFVSFNNGQQQEMCFGNTYYCVQMEANCKGLTVSFSYLHQPPIYSLQLDRPICYDLYQNCTWCANSTSRGDTIRYCYEAKNCAGAMGSASRCFDVSTSCNNAGTCVVGGLCTCNEGYYGPDCSVHLKDNCIETQNDKICWRLQFSDCQTVDVEIISRERGVIIRQNTSIDEPIRFPCQLLSNLSDCSMCIEIADLTISGDTLSGSPNITLCDKYPYALKSIPLVRSPLLSFCPSTTPHGSDPSSSGGGDSSTLSTSSQNASEGDMGKTLLLVLACVLVVVFFIGIAYFVATKYFGVDLPTPFQQDEQGVDVYADDEAPLNRKDEVQE